MTPAELFKRNLCYAVNTAFCDEVAPEVIVATMRNLVMETELLRPHARMPKPVTVAAQPVQRSQHISI